jgi:hypothetical protein
LPLTLLNAHKRREGSIKWGNRSESLLHNVEDAPCYPEERIRVVQDNLNTRTTSTHYEPFPCKKLYPTVKSQLD